MFSLGHPNERVYAKSWRVRSDIIFGAHPTQECYGKTEFLSCLQCYKARALQVLTIHLSNLFIIGLNLCVKAN